MKFQPPKGTRDLLPEDASKLQKIMQVCKDVFEKYGFEPLITPAFESFELLSAKGGLGEVVKDEIYYFKDKSNRELGLRFDLTMPLARVVSSNSFPKPFKRYAIDKVWRYDQPGSLRWREFFQADIDIIGSAGVLADIECLVVICKILDKLGFKDYSIRVNSRKLIQQLLENFIRKEELQNAFRILDKLDKNGIEWLRAEFSKLVRSGKNVNDIIEFMETKGRSWEILRDKNAENKYRFSDGLGLFDLKELEELANKFGIIEKIQMDASLVRGLEYYTGLVFEINLGAKVSSGGGGRYDNLIEKVGGQNTPAVGISLGLDRILEVMKENKMFKSKKTNTKVFVLNVDGNVKNDVIKIVSQLRENNINAQMDLMDRNFSKQLEYASNLTIPYVLIVGKEETGKKKFKLKDMKTGKQKELTLKEIISLLK